MARSSRQPVQRRTTILVRCEGEAEVRWLTGLRTELQEVWDGPRHARPVLDVKLVGGGNAVGRCREAAAEAGEADASRCFVVMDTEAHDPVRIRSTRDAMRQPAGGVETVFSHLCFEVWLHRLLPVRGSGRANDAEACKRSLRHRWRAQGVSVDPYRETDPLLYAKTRAQLDRELAQTGDQRPEPGDLEDATPPFTEVPGLVTELWSEFSTGSQNSG